MNPGALPTFATIAEVTEGTYSMPVAGSNAPPAQLAPPPQPGRLMVPRSDGGVNSGPCTYCLMNACASRRSWGVKSVRSASVTPWRSKAGGLVGKGCVGEVCSPGTLDCG